MQTIPARMQAGKELDMLMEKLLAPYWEEWDNAGQYNAPRPFSRDNGLAGLIVEEGRITCTPYGGEWAAAVCNASGSGETNWVGRTNGRPWVLAPTFALAVCNAALELLPSDAKELSPYSMETLSSGCEDYNARFHPRKPFALEVEKNRLSVMFAPEKGDRLCVWAGTLKSNLDFAHTALHAFVSGLQVGAAVDKTDLTPIDYTDAIRVLKLHPYRNYRIGIVLKRIPTLGKDYEEGEVVIFHSDGGPNISVERPMTEIEIAEQRRRGSLLTTKGTVVGVPAHYIKPVRWEDAGQNGGKKQCKPTNKEEEW